jgi:hypothetical protein
VARPRRRRMSGRPAFGSSALRFADKVQAPVDAVGSIDISIAGRPEHDGVPRGRTAKTVRGRIGVVVGLDLDDPAADAVAVQRGADQVGRHLMHAAAEEGFGQVFGHAS